MVESARVLIALKLYYSFFGFYKHKWSILWSHIRPSFNLSLHLCGEVPRAKDSCIPHKILQNLLTQTPSLHWSTNVKGLEETNINKYGKQTNKPPATSTGPPTFKSQGCSGGGLPCHDGGTHRHLGPKELRLGFWEPTDSERHQLFFNEALPFCPSPRAKWQSFVRKLERNIEEMGHKIAAIETISSCKLKNKHVFRRYSSVLITESLAGERYVDSLAIWIHLATP